MTPVRLAPTVTAPLSPRPAPPPPASPPSAPPAPAALDLLAGAARELLAAEATDDPGLRYARAHLAALRTSAAVLAARARPRPRRSTRVRPAWVLLAEVAPELGEWAAFFAAGAGKRAAAEAGLPGVVTAREADDLVREAGTFHALATRLLGLVHQPVLAPAPLSMSATPLPTTPLPATPLPATPLPSTPLSSATGTAVPVAAAVRRAG
jgi:hypothetical protein